jgi:CheY-like chemotaxis protein
MRIFIVDDNAAVLDSLVMLLRDGGHEVISAESGAEALGLIEKTQPECVVTDLNLADMKGDQLATEIRTRRPSLPIVLTSGQAPGASVGDASAADVFLAKPFTPKELVAALTEAQMRRRLAV